MEFKMNKEENVIELTKPKTFVVKRSTWFRGKGHVVSALLRSDNKMCCVGFLCIAAGATSSQILNKKCISRHIGLDMEYFTESSGASSNIALKIYEINDNMDLTDEQREEKLTELFKSIGIEIKFED